MNQSVNRYTITTRTKFTSDLELIPPGENHPQRIYHNYLLEAAVSGDTLSGDGFLIDIDELNRLLDEQREHFDHKLLNDLPDFSEKNPTLEAFAGVIAERLASQLRGQNLRELIVTLWENEKMPPPGPGAAAHISLK